MIVAMQLHDNYTSRDSWFLNDQKVTGPIVRPMRVHIYRNDQNMIIIVALRANIHNNLLSRS
jgi:hypothetical protein